MFMLLKKRPRYTFALNIARSDIFTQHSTFNSCTCTRFAVAKSLTSVEIKVLFKFIPVNHAKNFSGTFWYGFPVSPKCRCSQLLAGMQSICGLKIQVRHTDATLRDLLAQDTEKQAAKNREKPQHAFKTLFRFRDTNYVHCVRDRRHATKFEIRRQSPRNFFRAHTNCPINCQTIDRHMIVRYLKATSMQSTIFVEKTKRK